MMLFPICYYFPIRRTGKFFTKFFFPWSIFIKWVDSLGKDSPENSKFQPLKSIKPDKLTICWWFKKIRHCSFLPSLFLNRKRLFGLIPIWLYRSPFERTLFGFQRCFQIARKRLDFRPGFVRVGSRVFSHLKNVFAVYHTVILKVHWRLTLVEYMKNTTNVMLVVKLFLKELISKGTFLMFMKDKIGISANDFL